MRFEWSRRQSEFSAEQKRTEMPGVDLIGAAEPVNTSVSEERIFSLLHFAHMLRSY